MLKLMDISSTLPTVISLLKNGMRKIQFGKKYHNDLKPILFIYYCLIENSR